MTTLANSDAIEAIRSKLSKIEDREKKTRITRFIISALGNIPWAGSFIQAGTALHAEAKQGKINELQKLWMEEHQHKIEQLANAMAQIIEKLASSEADIQQRMATQEYLTLVRHGFREWDHAETFEKKEYLRKLLTNAATSSLSTDDMIRLFIKWIKDYHETHFMIIREVYKNQGITRGQIWRNISQSRPAENSVEADLYKLLIRDLSAGGIIRQNRPTDYEGNFIKRPSPGKSNPSTYKSAFDDDDQYELTGLGQRFVYYTMEEVTTFIDKP